MRKSLLLLFFRKEGLRFLNGMAALTRVAPAAICME
jgi:hypothetical protein